MARPTHDVRRPPLLVFRVYRTWERHRASSGFMPNNSGLAKGGRSDAIRPSKSHIRRREIRSAEHLTWRRPALGSVRPRRPSGRPGRRAPRRRLSTSAAALPASYAARVAPAIFCDAGVHSPAVIGPRSVGRTIFRDLLSQGRSFRETAAERGEEGIIALRAFGAGGGLRLLRLGGRARQPDTFDECARFGCWPLSSVTSSPTRPRSWRSISPISSLVMPSSPGFQMVRLRPG
jgi:hypothetical protein